MKKNFNAVSFIRNAMTTRQAWLSKLLDPRRDIDKECGHPEVLTIEDFERTFLRGDIAARVVNVWPEETWSEPPEVLETEDAELTAFEKAWIDLELQQHVYSILERADVLSGVGRFGIILLGVDDGGSLEEPIPGVSDKGLKTGDKNYKLLYLRTFHEKVVKVESLEVDKTNPRYGQPKFYTIEFSDNAQNQQAGQSAKVHWSRVIHLADNRMASEIFGVPRMEKVFNRLLDLKKVVGGSGEMFWKGGFPGYSIETVPDPEGGTVELDKESTKEQMEAYMNGLQRYIATVGLTVKNLTVQIAEPTSHVDVQLKLIAAAVGVPWRIFVGSEAAQLASEQDSRTWNRRLTRRRARYVTPFVLSPFIDRLILLGILPAPKTPYMIKWPDINMPSDKDKADIAEKRTNALAKYVVSGAHQIVPPMQFFTRILGMTDKEAQSIVDEAGDFDLDVTEEGQGERQAGGSTTPQ